MPPVPRSVPRIRGFRDADVLEFGAGTGAMSAEVLRTLELEGALPARYLILEISADLRARQAETLASKVPWLAGTAVGSYTAANTSVPPLPVRLSFKSIPVPAENVADPAGVMPPVPPSSVMMVLAVMLTPGLR